MERSKDYENFGVCLGVTLLSSVALATERGSDPVANTRGVCIPSFEVQTNIVVNRSANDDHVAAVGNSIVRNVLQIDSFCRPTIVSVGNSNAAIAYDEQGRLQSFDIASTGRKLIVEYVSTDANAAALLFRLVDCESGDPLGSKLALAATPSASGQFSLPLPKNPRLGEHQAGCSAESEEADYSGLSNPLPSSMLPSAPYPPPLPRPPHNSVWNRARGNVTRLETL